MLRSISICILQLFLYCKYVTYFSLFILISNFSFIYYVNNVVKHMEWERLDHVAILPYPFTLQNVRNSLRCGPTCLKPDFTCTFYAYLLYACNFIHMIYQNYKNHTHGSTWNYIFQNQDSIIILKWTIRKQNLRFVSVSYTEQSHVLLIQSNVLNYVKIKTVETWMNIH